MKDEKRTADELEKYIDRPETYDGDLEPGLERVVDSLHHAASQPRPRPGFVNELAQRLQEKERTMSEKSRSRKLWSAFRRVAAGGVALAALLALVVVAAGLFSRFEPEPAALDEEQATESDTPIQTVVATEGAFEGAEFVLMTELSDEPGEAALLTVLDVRSPPQTDGGQNALAAAPNFGILDGTLYESPNDPNGWMVMAEDGRSVSYRQDGPLAGHIYYNNPQAQRETGERLPYAEAVEIAREFLQLPDDYEAAPEQSAPSSSHRAVRFYKVFEGRPIVGTEAAAEVAVSPGGQVAYARLMPMDVTPAGDPIPVKSARQAFDDLLQGEAGYSFSYNYAGPDPVQHFKPPPPEWEVGDAVTVEGWLTVLPPVNGGEPHAELRARDGVTTYLLTGPDVAELVDYSDQQIRASGAIAEQRGPARWEMTLASWEAQPPPEGQSGACQIGLFRRDGDAATLETDEGETYQLAYPPEELSGGERVEVCADAFSTGEPVEWVRMASPPASEANRSGGGGSGAVTVAEAVEVTPAVTTGGGAVSESVTEIVGASDEAPASPYELGEPVSVIGTLIGSIEVDGDERTLDLGLLVNVGEDPLAPPLYFPLNGRRELLEEMSEHYRLHVSVQGTVVAAGEERHGPDGQAIQVQGFERVWPEEKLEAFLGRVQVETLEGRQVAVFTDETTEQRYVLAPHYPGRVASERVWLSGVVHPEATFAGLPLLEPLETRTGSNVDAAESAGDLPLQTEIPVYDSAPAGGPPWMQGTLIIEEVVLGYHYQPTPRRPDEENGGADGPQRLEPVWIFTGHSDDGTIAFTIFVDAALSPDDNP